MRRSGSAAPHSSWSPTVNAVRYSPPIGSLRSRPIGTRSVPVTAAGVSSRSDDSLSFGTTVTHSCAAASSDSISASGTSCVSLMVSAWLWHRIELMRTHRPSIGMPDGAENLVALGHRLPFFLALAVAEILGDPGQQAPGERVPAEFAGRQIGRAQRGGDAAIDLEDRRGRVGERRRDGAMQVTHLRDHLAHVPGAGARGGLVGHRRDPLDEAGAEEAGHRHQHQAHRAVGADVVLEARGQRAIDDVAVDRVEDEDRVVLHPQRRRGVDPVAVPARFAQLRVDLRGVVAALAGDQDVARRQRGEVFGVLDGGRALAHGRAFGARLRRGEEHGIDQVEVALLAHALHQHRPHHAAPTDESNVHSHLVYPEPRLSRRAVGV